jgi:hypothetical protein
MMPVMIAEMISVLFWIMFVFMGILEYYAGEAYKSDFHTKVESMIVSIG